MQSSEQNAIDVGAALAAIFAAKAAPTEQAMPTLFYFQT